MTDDTYDRLVEAMNRAVGGGYSDDALKAYGLDPSDVRRWEITVRAEILDSLADYVVVDAEGNTVEASDPALIGVIHELMLNTGLIAGIELGRSEGRKVEE